MILAFNQWQAVGDAIQGAIRGSQSQQDDQSDQETNTQQSEPTNHYFLISGTHVVAGPFDTMNECNQMFWQMDRQNYPEGLVCQLRIY